MLKLEYQNPISRLNYTRYEKNIMIENCSLQKDLQIWIENLFIKCMLFFLIQKITIGNLKFNFLTRICEIRKNVRI